MIHITRVTQAKDTLEFESRLTLPDQATSGLFLSQLATALSQRPETVFVIKATSDKTGLLGFGIAALGAGRVVNLHQAWIDPKASPELVHELMSRLMLWAVGNDRSEIEVRTQRSANALYRHSGFEESAMILTKTIPEEFTQRLLNSLKETENG